MQAVRGANTKAMRASGLDRAEGFGCGKDLDSSVAERLVQELVLKKFLSEEARENGGGYTADYLSLGPKSNALLGSHPPQVVVKFRSKAKGSSAPKSAKAPKAPKEKAASSKAPKPRAGPGPAYDDDDGGDEPEGEAMVVMHTSKGGAFSTSSSSRSISPKPRQTNTPKAASKANDSKKGSTTTATKATKKKSTPPKGYSGAAAQAYGPGGVMEMVNAMSDDGSSDSDSNDDSDSSNRTRARPATSSSSSSYSSSSSSAPPPGAPVASKHFLSKFQEAALPLPSKKPKPARVGRLGSKVLENLLSTYLHQWLDAYGSEHNIASFNIADSKAVLDLVKYVPQTRNDLKQLNGWGAHKLSMHGDLILTQIESFLEEHNVELVGSFVAPGVAPDDVGVEEDSEIVVDNAFGDGDEAGLGLDPYPDAMLDTGGGGSDFEDDPWG